MARSARQMKILELITDNVVETQDDLARMLKESGFNATQATISRDIKELGIVKMSIDGKRQKYVREYGDRSVSNDKLVNIFKSAVVSILYANNIVVCVAGDDTVMAVAKSEAVAREITDELSELLEQ